MVTKRTPMQIAEERIENARKSNTDDLDLSGLGLTVLPDSIGDLGQLRHLSLRDNQLTALPDSISSLTRLLTFWLTNNQLTDLPDSIGLMSSLSYLHVSNNRLSTLPETIGELNRLGHFYVWNNGLAALPYSICKLSQLWQIDLGRNALTMLPREFGDLTYLRHLNLYGNALRALPESLRHLTNLEVLDLRDNPELNLPPEVVGLEGEAAVGTGEASLGRPAAILDYYFSKRVSRPLNEAKMILVGRGGAGKTSLVNRLVHGRYNSKESKTDGIAITQWPVKVGKDDVRLNIWDFGGQEIMHATHQFVLTKRSLYVLVLNAREGDQDANVEYWLQLIDSVGGDSPVLVVINKVQDHPFDLNRRGLQVKFPAIHGFLQTDCDADVGIGELRQAILRETDRLEHLRDPFPASWFAVKDKLADLPRTEKRNFIPFVRYQQLCLENGVHESTSQETLVTFLHDLGIVVNFRDDPRLAETHVLNPEWVTNGIYKILNAERLAKKQGELRLVELPAVLDSREYPKGMHLYLLDLMRKFELCFEYYESAGQYLVRSC